MKLLIEYISDKMWEKLSNSSYCKDWVIEVWTTTVQLCWTWQLSKAPSLNLLVSLSSWPYLVALTGLDPACFVTSLCHPNCYIQAQSCSIHGTVCSSVCCIRPESSQQCPRPSDQSTMARCLHTGSMCSLAPATQTSSGIVSSLTMAAVDVCSSLPWQIREKPWMLSIRFLQPEVSTMGKTLSIIGTKYSPGVFTFLLCQQGATWFCQNHYSL